jgi:hypothetical protein
MTSRPRWLGVIWIVLFIVGGGLVLVLQSAASTEPRSSRNYDDVQSLATLVTVGWLIVMVVLAVVWLTIARRGDDAA